MNIGIVVLGLDYSGAEIVLNKYLKDTEKVSAKVILIFYNHEVVEKFSTLLGRENVICLKLKYNKYLFRLFNFTYSKHIINKINEIKNLDLIYFNNTYEGLLVSKFVKNLNKPTIFHIHDMKESIRNPYLKLCTEKYMNNFDKIITVSYKCKNSWNIKDIEVVYNGLEEKWFDDGKIKKYKIENIGFIGGLTIRKGVDILLDTIPNMLDDNNLIFHFIFAQAEDELLKKLNNLKEKYGENRIEIIGKLDQEDIKKYYDKLDLIVVPSRQDPLPTVIMEASSRKVLCLGNNIGGIPELITDKRMVTDLSSQELLFNKLKEVINLNYIELDNMKEKQYLYTKKNFNCKNKTYKIDEIIESTIDRYRNFNNK